MAINAADVDISGTMIFLSVVLPNLILLALAIAAIVSGWKVISKESILGAKLFALFTLLLMIVDIINTVLLFTTSDIDFTQLEGLDPAILLVFQIALSVVCCVSVDTGVRVPDTVWF